MIIAGVDEVGRGCLAGPVVSAAVILKDSINLKLLKDSKKITFKKRIEIAKHIKLNSTYAVGISSVEEILNLNDVVNNPKTPALTIIGGSKISTKITVIKNLLQKMDSIVIAGGMANNFLKYLGNDVKNSLIENDVDHLVKEIINFANEQNCKLILPLDVVTAEKVSETTEINECAVDAVKNNQMILDIGKQTIELIKNEISNCETVFWNGPVGVFETKPFHKGTFEIAKFIAEITDKNSLRSFAGGGDTIYALDMADVKDKFSYVSTGGGALLELIEGKKLPGLVALGAL